MPEYVPVGNNPTHVTERKRKSTYRIEFPRNGERRSREEDEQDAVNQSGRPRLLGPLEETILGSYQTISYEALLHQRLVRRSHACIVYVVRALDTFVW
jgi:hypothetical protein